MSTETGSQGDKMVFNLSDVGFGFELIEKKQDLG